MSSKGSMAANSSEQYSVPTGIAGEINGIFGDPAALESYLKFIFYVYKESLEGDHKLTNIVDCLNLTHRLTMAKSPLSSQAQQYVHDLFAGIIKTPLEEQERLRYQYIWEQKCPDEHQDVIKLMLRGVKLDEEEVEVGVKISDEECKATEAEGEEHNKIHQEAWDRFQQDLDGWLMDKDIEEHDRNGATEARSRAENPTEKIGSERSSERKHKRRHRERRSGSHDRRHGKEHSERRSESNGQRRGEGQNGTPRNSTQKGGWGMLKAMVNDIENLKFSEPRSEMRSARVSRK